MASKALEWIGGLRRYGLTSHFRPGICGGQTLNKEREILAHLAARGLRWQQRVRTVNQACHLLVSRESLYSLCVRLNCVIRSFNCFPRGWRKLDSWSIHFSWTVSVTLGRGQLRWYYLKTIKWCEHLPQRDSFSPGQPKSGFLQGCFTRATHSPGSVGGVHVHPGAGVGCPYSLGTLVFSVVMSVIK